MPDVGGIDSGWLWDRMDEGDAILWRSFRKQAMERGWEPSQRVRLLGTLVEELALTDIVLRTVEEHRTEPEDGLGRAATRALKGGGPPHDDAARFLIERGLASLVADLLYPPRGEEDEIEP